LTNITYSEIGRGVWRRIFLLDKKKVGMRGKPLPCAHFLDIVVERMMLRVASTLFNTLAREFPRSVKRRNF
jgi:hypothetical protein